MSEPAEAAKRRGNELFCKGRHAAAREAYTEAIALDATVSTFYSNRALCAKALGDWAAVEVDAQKALETERNNTKGAKGSPASVQVLLTMMGVASREIFQSVSLRKYDQRSGQRVPYVRLTSILRPSYAILRKTNLPLCHCERAV